jgi:hypothetical protein
MIYLNEREFASILLNQQMQWCPFCALFVEECHFERTRYVLLVPLLLETPKNDPRRPVSYSDKYSVGFRWPNKALVHCTKPIFSEKKEAFCRKDVESYSQMPEKRIISKMSNANIQNHWNLIQL